MSSWSGGEKRSQSSKGWRGKQVGSSKPAHAWQGQPGGRSQHGRDSGHRWKDQWRIYVLLGAGLLGLFLYLLLVRPKRTPMLMFTGIGYSAPTPPNEWVLEDRDALSKLSQTLTLEEITGSWIGEKSEARVALGERLAEHQGLRRGLRTIREPLVLYLSMPGLVNDQGEPCLLPPGASPLDSENWLSIAQLFGDIDRIVPPERHKLLILDCNQVLVNWGMGITYNTFMQRLRQYVAGDLCKVRNLAVLTAADEGQVSWASPHLGGSAFGQFLSLGLAGAADRDGPNPDGEVSLHELVAYVRAQVGGWAWSNRASKQQPTLLTTESELDFFVTYALSSGALAPYREALISAKSSPPSVTVEEIGTLWSRLDDLKTFDVLRYNPIALGDYHNRLLRLERLAYGGKAYQTDARQAALELRHQLESAADQSKRESRALADHLSVTSPDTRSVQLGKPLHSLPLCEYFGKIDPSTSSRLQLLWQQLSGMEPPAEQSESLIQTALQFEQTQLLVAAHQQRAREPREGSILLRQVLELRARAEQLAVPRDSQAIPGDERAHYYVRPALNVADEIRRRAEDLLFLPASTAAEEQQLFAQANKAYDRARAIGDNMSKALAICDAAWAETPHLGEWLCQPGIGGHLERKPEEIVDLLSLIHANHELGAEIGGGHGFRQ
jgi:hypothetical protein